MTNTSITSEIIDVIMEIRDTGLTNMLDLKTVKHIAGIMGYLDFIKWLDSNKETYSEFIMTGKG